jgi:hypothetical protein
MNEESMDGGSVRVITEVELWASSKYCNTEKTRGKSFFFFLILARICFSIAG